MNGIFHTHGGNVRNQKTTFPHVVKRQEAAKKRQEEAAKRTPEEQLKRLDAAGLASPKERAKLAQRIADRNKPKPPPKEQVGNVNDKELAQMPEAERKEYLKAKRRQQKESGGKKKFNPFNRTGPVQVSAEDAEKLSGEPAPLKVIVPVVIEE